MSERGASCPGCGAPVRFAWSSAVQTSCPYCHSIIVRRDVDLEKVGEVADLPRELDFVAVGRELSVVGDANLVVLDTQQLDERDCVAVDLPFLQFGFALPLTGFGVGFPGQGRAVLLEREGVFLMSDL